MYCIYGSTNTVVQHKMIEMFFLRERASRSISKSLCCPQLRLSFLPQKVKTEFVGTT